MSHRQLAVSSINPNDTTGGRGCICSSSHQTDCKPPYVVFYGNELADDLSPHVVACGTCITAAYEALGGEVLPIGEKNEVPVTFHNPGSSFPQYAEIDTLPVPVSQTFDDEDIPEV